MVEKSKTSEGSKCSKHKGAFCLFSIIIIAASLFALAWAINGGLKQFRTGDRYVTVKGLAEKSVKSDLAAFNISFVASGDDLQSVYAKIKADSVKVKDFLMSFDIIEDDISFSVNANDKVASSYDSRNVSDGNRYIVNATYNVRTKNVDAVAKLNLSAGDLIASGINVGYYNTNYYFNGINEIKSELLSEAISAARDSAKRFADDSGSKLGTIRQANQGAISIIDESSEYSSNVTMNKTVRVVSTVVYSLED